VSLSCYLPPCFSCRHTDLSQAGVLNPDIKPAQFCPFLDINNNSQLNRFGLHNGGAQDRGLLNEKWEGLALVPVDPSDCGDKPEYFLFVSADNDFLSTDGKFRPIFMMS
jgi:hypothetical protein